MLQNSYFIAFHEATKLEMCFTTKSRLSLHPIWSVYPTIMVIKFHPISRCSCTAVCAYVRAVTCAWQRHPPFINTDSHIII